ncbi:MAG: 1-acyl-sn-glycerol-3-phosphate acyltransferase [Kineosporiaceae bacterium]
MTTPEQTSASAARSVAPDHADGSGGTRRSGISPRLPSPGTLELVDAVGAARRAGIAFVRRHHRLETTTTDRMPDSPVLFVMNHGFGGAADLNVLAALAALEELALTREVTILCHQIAWTLGLGKVVEAGGARPATSASATEAFGLGHHVLVAPGGDVEAAKSFADRNRVVFSGRRGFARLAAEKGVPIVPIVTAGAGETLLVLRDGQELARALRMDDALRMKVLPVSVSLPWGFSVGVAGLLPYLPIPAKLVTAVLHPMWPADGETAEAFGDRVEAAMQAKLSEMTAHRRLVLG